MDNNEFFEKFLTDRYPNCEEFRDIEQSEFLSALTDVEVSRRRASSRCCADGQEEEDDNSEGRVVKGCKEKSGGKGERGEPGKPGIVTIIPFASSESVPVSVLTDGNSADGVMLGFSSNNKCVPIQDNGDIILYADEQNAFSIPFNCYLKSAYFTAGNSDFFRLDNREKLYPYIELFNASAESNCFHPVECSVTYSKDAFCGLTAPNTLVHGEKSGLHIPLFAGERLLIVGRIKRKGLGGDCGERLCYSVYYTGGIGLSV